MADWSYVVELLINSEILIERTVTMQPDSDEEEGPDDNGHQIVSGSAHNVQTRMSGYLQMGTQELPDPKTMKLCERLQVLVDLHPELEEQVRRECAQLMPIYQKWLRHVEETDMFRGVLPIKQQMKWFHRKWGHKSATEHDINYLFIMNKLSHDSWVPFYSNTVAQHQVYQELPYPANEGSDIYCFKTE